MNHLTKQEIEQFAEELNFSEKNFSGLKKAILNKVEAARNELPQGGAFFSDVNRVQFLDAIKEHLGAGRVKICPILFNAPVLVVVDKFLRLYVYDKCITFDNVFDYLDIGLSPQYYDVILDFLFNEQGVCYPLYKKTKELNDTIDYIDELLRSVDNRYYAAEALKDSTKYDDMKSKYEAVASELHQYSPFVPDLAPWETFLKKTAIDDAIEDIDYIRAKAADKSAKQCSDMQSTYEKAQVILQGASLHGLVSNDYIQPWGEFINAITKANTPEKLRSNYIEKVAQAYKDHLEYCYRSDTAYMKKKRAKIEADLELCRQLKELYNADCFIDRSIYSKDVTHMNIVMSDSKVFIFRMGTYTPDIEACEDYIHVVQAVDSIIAATGKTVKIVNCDYKQTSKLAVSESTELGKQLQEMLKFVKGGYLKITPRSAVLTVPLGFDGIEFSFPKKAALEGYPKVIDALQLLVDTVKSHRGFRVKGIFHERMPHL